MPNQFNDLKGQTFHKLTVICWHSKAYGRSAKWNCKCECGKKTVVDQSNLISGHTRSCGHDRGKRTDSPSAPARPKVDMFILESWQLAAAGKSQWAR